MSNKRRSSLRIWMEVNEAISSVELNKICSTEGLTFNLCTSLNHFMVLENNEIETSHSRNVCTIESILGQKLQWLSVSILNFLSSFLVMIILCNILNKNCLKPRLNDRNMATQHIATLLGATCCMRLATALRSVATCWLLLAQV